MKKRGFTLAEILITLGIIGVVAALTAPALVQNAGQSKIGPALSKFVNTFEVGIETMMHEEAVNRLSSLGKQEDWMNLLSKYVVMTPVQGCIQVQIMYASGKKQVESLNHEFCNGKGWTLKDGSLIVVYNASAYNAKASYLGQAANVVIDIGGINGKHRIGKEVFSFLIDDNGKLVPWGSNAYSFLSGKKIACDTTKDDFEANLSCTGAIADNNWKADY